jgi:hypothetical protein
MIINVNNVDKCLLLPLEDAITYYTGIQVTTLVITVVITVGAATVVAATTVAVSSIGLKSTVAYV